MTTLRRSLGWVRRWARFTLFENNHPITTNLLYSLYMARCRKKWKRPSSVSATIIESARSLRNQGYAVLPPAADSSLISTISSTVDELFEQGRDTVTISSGLFRLRDGVERLPRIIEHISPDIEQIIEEYFGSHFKIFGVYFYRTIPTDGQTASSFLWHFDNCPRHEIKLMVYLDDTTGETGAFRLKPKPLSDEMKAQGFWDRNKAQRFQTELENGETTDVLEGPAGTRILFQNGGCIHKGTFPVRKHRDVVTFVIIPSPVPWRVHFARNRHLLSTNSGVCLNPFTDRPQSVGYLE